ncbi:LolA family protein [Paenarthrobacter nitroguajacolicus]|uniref:LolA family protein n=1 Tax=Paenarthrobacter nitroguajacolicus TaxID=211146 RepID=UPI004053C0B1
MARARQRWLPAFFIPLALAMAVLFGSVQAGATVSLPPKSADEILTMIAGTKVRALSGTLEQTAELGLPEIPTPGPGMGPGAASALEFLAGTHTARVFVDGPLRARLQILDEMAERDVVINGADAWFYNSRDNSAAHLTVPVPSEAEPQGPLSATPDAPDMTAPDMTAPNMPTPAAIAGRFLDAIDASTEVTVSGSSTVAGRSAYSLVLNPRSIGTLVDSVTIDVDSETGLPLGVAVRANGQVEPAYSIVYTTLDLSTPDASLFNFTPPQGATVTEKVLPAEPVRDSAAREGQITPGHATPGHGGTATGEGWESVVALPAGSAPAELTSNPQLSQALQPVTGGRALTTSLLSVLILDDGSVYAGMVPLERLQSAAASK